MSGFKNAAGLLALFVALSACAPSLTTAQADPDSIHLRNDCRLAGQVLATGHPATRTQWALGVIRRCRDGGAPLARALERSRQSTDTASLNALTSPAINLRDGTVFEKAIEIAGDEGASVQARVFAIRTLIWSIMPGGGISYADLVGTENHVGSCGYGPSLHTVVTAGLPLPGDFLSRAKALANTIVQNRGESRDVRRAAQCLREAQTLPTLLQ